MFNAVEKILQAIAIGLLTIVITIGFISKDNNDIENVLKINRQQNSTYSASTPTNTKVATTSLSSVLATSTSSTTISNISTSTANTTKKSSPASKKAIPIPADPLPTPISPPEEKAPTYTVQEINTKTREALVNILCTTIAGGPLKPITGSGIIIDSRGVILTNAHIGQLWLLQDYPQKNSIDCLIRMGSPATPKYRAKLIYLSPQWIDKNKSDIVSQNPTGTGENDFAFLLITSTTNGNPLPINFPAVSINTEEMTLSGIQSDVYLVAAYPADLLGSVTILRDLFITSTSLSPKQVFTFKEATIDVLSLGGSPVAQKGSSGGAVVRVKDNKLVGIIVTTTEGGTTGERDLRAITTTHINHSLEENSNSNIQKLLSGDLNDKIEDFRKNLFPLLRDALVTELTK